MREVSEWKSKPISICSRVHQSHSLKCKWDKIEWFIIDNECAVRQQQQQKNDWARMKMSFLIPDFLLRYLLSDCWLARRKEKSWCVHDDNLNALMCAFSLSFLLEWVCLVNKNEKFFFHIFALRLSLSLSLASFLVIRHSVSLLLQWESRCVRRKKKRKKTSPLYALMCCI
jgi:hypothetical protein